MGKVQGSEELSGMLKHILFSGDDIPFNPYNIAMADGEMYGFLTNDNGITRVSNRIFESLLYDYFLNSNESHKDDMYLSASRSKNQFIERDRLDMDKVLERFVVSFLCLSGDFHALRIMITLSNVMIGVVTSVYLVTVSCRCDTVCFFERFYKEEIVCKPAIM